MITILKFRKKYNIGIETKLQKEKHLKGQKIVQKKNDANIVRIHVNKITKKKKGPLVQDLMAIRRQAHSKNKYPTY